MRRSAAALAALSLLATAAVLDVTDAPAEASALDGASVVPLQVTGDPSERFNLVLLGDGYTEEEMPLFREQVDQHLNVQWSIEPFRSYRNYFNVYLVETPSAESGVDCDPAHGWEERDTALGMGFFNGCDESALERLLTVDASAANAAADLVPGVPANNRQILALANSETYGGAGGRLATASSGNALSALISPHELAHSLGGLQDEYPYYFRDTSLGRYTGAEPTSAHHTLMSSERMLEEEAKWWRWLGEESESGGVIGAADADGHEGGLYHSEGVWRPSNHSMLKTLGYYFDQVGREVMTRRISGLRDQATLPVSSTPEGEVGAEDAVWVEGPHPVHHELDYTWTVDGEELAEASGARGLELAGLDLDAGTRISVRVQDPTEFVRDPAIRDSPAMTQTRTWTVGAAQEPVEAQAGFTRHRDTERAVSATEVVYAETTRPTDRLMEVAWELDGETVSTSADGRTLDLGAFDLSAGDHVLTATVTDPAGSDSESLTWTVDATDPTAPRELSEAAATVSGGEHHLFLNEFSMRLSPEDDGEGHVVGEFRVDGDGWHHYYGWPEDSGAPFRFTPDGTNVDDLVYGSLGSGGLSMAVFEVDSHEPGWGTHTVEHRAIDSAGNIGGAESFRATVVPGTELECAETVTGRVNGGLDVDEGVVCLDGADVRGGVTVAEGASLVVRGGSVRGGLTASGAHTVRLSGTEVNGAVSITGTTSEVTLLGSAFSGSLALNGNTQVPAASWTGGDEGYGPVMAANTVRGSLSCSGNSRAVADFGAANDVTGSVAGQCSDL
ncbi:M64 family metallopeptidase [Nocardiopsis sp. NPDC006938]|uniref:M64 family metallopeptidase n=1 Tax=Nocardiopsis sp. NPDC006938 TaxID=3364337 RepID=UPI0036782EC0